MNYDSNLFQSGAFGFECSRVEEYIWVDTEPTAHYLFHGKCCNSAGLFHLCNLYKFIVAKLKNSLERLIKFAVSASPFTYGDKNFRLINKRMQSGLVGGSGDSFQQDGNLGLLRNKANKGNIDNSKTERTQKGESHRTHLSKVEIFRWL